LGREDGTISKATGEAPMNTDAARNLAGHWVAAWNAHDLDSIMSHYEDEIELTSPVAAQLLGTPDGKITGKANVRAYFQRGLEAYPDLHFHLEDVL
jgi:ketosteroid isomerase-like protein